MQYLFLIYAQEEDMPETKSPEEFAAMMKPWNDYTEELTRLGVFVAGEALQSVKTATTVTAQSGEPVFTDGPFAETKEQLGGFYMVNCKDLDQAMTLAAKCPGTLFGRVEVRPIADLGE
ncbi:MAG: YciI family protein [Myxococcota bacterium]